MSVDTWIRDLPMLVPEDYKTRFASPCEQQSSRDFPWYKGTGIEPAKHPLHWDIPFQYASCKACDSKQVLVIAAQWNVSYSNGDKYWDYEVECQECGKFTKRSYAD